MPVKVYNIFSRSPLLAKKKIPASPLTLLWWWWQLVSRPPQRSGGWSVYLLQVWSRRAARPLRTFVKGSSGLWEATGWQSLHLVYSSCTPVSFKSLLSCVNAMATSCSVTGPLMPGLVGEGKAAFSLGLKSTFWGPLCQVFLIGGRPKFANVRRNPTNVELRNSNVELWNSNVELWNSNVEL